MTLDAPSPIRKEMAQNWTELIGALCNVLGPGGITLENPLPALRGADITQIDAQRIDAELACYRQALDAGLMLGLVPQTDSATDPDGSIRRRWRERIRDTVEPIVTANDSLFVQRYPAWSVDEGDRL